MISPTEVFAKDDDQMDIKFLLEIGEVCALGDDWSHQKSYCYKKVQCDKGIGWVTNVSGVFVEF
ncbi:hypothetical protein DDE05_00485 [Streptomyces cavourensis]|nr:hypothetical protein DDE05_00485 [Streptomyces cavourensis]